MRNIDAKEFKKAMVESNIDSYLQLEEATGLNRSTLSSIVKGEQKPSYDTIGVLADALHLTYEELGRIFFTKELA
ncbi:MAG: helix-turn-helix transcriptional regulator [Clostridiales bacterium]|nr:helix-turn-helix transcriptional regulator [Clostridiales bacterium]